MRRLSNAFGGLGLVMLFALAAGCGDDDEIAGPLPDHCSASALPLGGVTDAPTVTDVALDVQTSVIALLATATDPQGDANLQNIPQTIGVFPDANCDSSPIELTDDFVGSGVEESFGTAVDKSTNPALYDAIAAATSWPVSVDVVDADGHRTTGRVMARVIH